MTATGLTYFPLVLTVCWMLPTLPLGPPVAATFAREARYVCDGATARPNSEVTLRGTARLTSDGLVLGDYTCPAGRSKGERLPLLILVDVKGFLSPRDRDLYTRKRTSLSAARAATFQLVVHGDIQCKMPFRFRTNEDGEFVSGNGYGSHGLIKCKIQRAQVLEMHEID